MILNVYGYQCPHCQTKFKVGRAPNYETGETIENSWCPECFKTVRLTLDNYISDEISVIVPVNKLTEEHLMTKEKWDAFYSLLLHDLKQDIMKDLKGDTHE